MLIHIVGDCRLSRSYLEMFCHRNERKLRVACQPTLLENVPEVMMFDSSH